MRTIQPIGKKPVTAPRIAARRARLGGIVKAQTATPIATSNAMMAIGALTRLEAISTKSVITGSAAAAVDSVALPNGS